MNRQAASWGITHGYYDIAGDWHETPDETARRFLEAMGAGDAPEPPPSSTLVVRSEEQTDLGGRWQLVTEDGAELTIEDRLPPDLPLGYHTLSDPERDRRLRLIVTPGICRSPGRHRSWGFSVQLPTLRSASSWGIGDLGDLRGLAEWCSRDLHAGLLMVNPLHAALPGVPQEPSPYSPSSRIYRNLLYLRMEEVPGFSGVRPDLPVGSIVERDPVYRAKSTALSAAWEKFEGDPTFDRYREAEGEALEDYATWCALIDHLGAEAPLPHPSGAEVERFREDHAREISFHCWVQWLLDRQLARAGAELSLMQDLAVGFHPDGADAWRFQDLLAHGVRIGAPPDEFNPQGQDWGLPPFDPWRLREVGYEPFIRTIRACVQHSGGLRVDHVMGLFRLYWVPRGRPATEGAYVRYPWKDMLGILALESVRAGAYIVGEDLGTVEDEVRAQLAEAGVLTYRLLWFENRPPAQYPEPALAAVTTHDLPTIAGLWTGSDLEEQIACGIPANRSSTMAIRDRLKWETGLGEDATVDEVVSATYSLLSEAPSAVVCATLEDALGVERRPNLPGTTSQARPNWSIALPATLEDIQHDPRLPRLAGLLRRGED